MGVFIRVSKHWFFFVFLFCLVVIPAQVQSPAQSLAVVTGVEAGSRLWNLNLSHLQFAVAHLPNSHFPLSPILLSR